MAGGGAAAAASVDVKRERRDLYAPPAGRFTLVDVPPMWFLLADGHGDPNTVAEYREVVEALFALSYSVRAVAKHRLGRVHTVGPLEGLWSADDLAVFRRREKSAWDWTMMIVQPEWVTSEIVAEARERAAKKELGAAGRVRFEEFDEGRCVQILHRGSYDDEGPVLQRLHEEFLPGECLVERGRHHEIYLSDPRKTPPARLKTILRQPVAPSSRSGHGPVAILNT